MERREQRAAERRRRSDHGTIRFWERDGELLGYTGEQYALTLEQLSRLTGSNLRTVTNLRNRWRRAGWVDSYQLIWRGAAFFWLTREGAKVAQSPYRALPPNPGLAQHTAAVTDVRLLLEHELALGEWECERSLARTTWARGKRTPHLPDGVLDGGAGRIAIEVELSAKGPMRLEPILTDLCRRYPRVWYFASERVAPTLKRLAAETPWRNITVHPFPASPGDMAP